MENRCSAAVLAASCVALMSSAASAVPLYTQNFDVDASATFTFNSSTAGDTANDGLDNEANYFFDYSTVGIPSAPRSVGGTTRGLKIEANIADGTGTFQGASVSPIGQSFSGEYILSFDRWTNYNFANPNAPAGTGGGSGRSQFSTASVGTSGANSQFPGAVVQGAMFSTDPSTFQSSHYRIYTAGGAPAAPETGYYNAGVGADGSADAARSVSNPYYSDAFPSQNAPAAQVALFPEQGGVSTTAGSQGFAWHQESLTVQGDNVTWTIDGVTIGTIPLSALTLDPAGNIALGQFDVNTSSFNPATDPNGRSLLFGLFDNVSVSPVPEPTSVALLAMAVPMLLRRRR